jgi:hypothetical protein
MNENRKRSPETHTSTAARIESLEREARSSKRFRERVKGVLELTSEGEARGYAQFVGKLVRIRMSSGRIVSGRLVSELKFQLVIRDQDQEYRVNKGQIEILEPDKP